MTLLYTVILTILASCLIRFAVQKLRKIRNKELNEQGISVYTVRILRLIILEMVSALLVNILLDTLIIGCMILEQQGKDP